MFRVLSVHVISPLAIVISVAGASVANPARIDLDAFHAVDTKSLLGSPDPLPPMEIVNAFPNLVFQRPVAITNARDGSNRLFIVDLVGVIYVIENRSDVERAEVFLDLRDVVLTKFFEEGLLGLAFHPRYSETGEFFVYYSIAKPHASIVSRFRVSKDDPNRADRSSEQVIMTIPEPYPNHNSGGIEFGPDGMLYIPLGDGGAANDPHGNGQNLETLLASILRIDIDRKDAGLEYAIPPDNPFVGERGKKFGDQVRGEIWAYGVRNPWRMTFDRLNGDLWIGDVGQDRFEEIDVIVKGGNYGWKVREGLHSFDEKAKTTGEPFIEPILEYPRQEGKSITGGLVYRGAAFPELYGAYFYTDFVTFNIWALRYNGQKVTSNHLIARSTLPVSAFGEDESGEVYFAAFEARQGVDIRRLNAGQVFNLNIGRVYKFVPRASEDVDTARFPRRLSETGLFTNLEMLEPAPGLIPYDVNVPLWSDGARKERYIALPERGSVSFDERGHWGFPVGTVLVKSFFMPNGVDGGEHRLETRLLVRSERGWDGYTYLWDDDHSDAKLLDAALTRSYPVGANGETREWYFPSRSDCAACHTKVAGHVLGVNTRQLNRSHDFGGARANQLWAFERLGVFEKNLPAAAEALDAYPDWAEDQGPASARARAYLDVNCAICHQPGGTGLSKADMRSHTPLVAAGLVGHEPGQKRYGGADSKVIAPGAPERSELLLRMMRGETGGRMPPLASSRVDWKAVRVIGAWIESVE